MEYVWVYNLNNSFFGVVSADNKVDAENKIYDKYTNLGIDIDVLHIVKAEKYIGYDNDHNVLEISSNSFAWW